MRRALLNVLPLTSSQNICELTYAVAEMFFMGKWLTLESWKQYLNVIRPCLLTKKNKHGLIKLFSHFFSVVPGFFLIFMFSFSFCSISLGCHFPGMGHLFAEVPSEICLLLHGMPPSKSSLLVLTQIKCLHMPLFLLCVSPLFFLLQWLPLSTA